MKLPRAGREFANWDVSGAPESPVFEVKFLFPDATDSGWIVAETVSRTHVRQLVQGPDADAHVGSTELPLGMTDVEIRLVDTPEIVVRVGGRIEVS